MKNKPLHRIACALLLTGIVTSASAAEILDPVADKVTKVQKTHTRAGVMDTLLLYHFPEENAVLQITIGNANTGFPITPVLHVFPKAASEESVGLWIQNQRNCALMPDAAEPEKTHPLSDAGCTVTSRKSVGEEESRSGKFSKFEIEFEMKNIPAAGDIQIKDFSDEATVFVKVQAG